MLIYACGLLIYGKLWHYARRMYYYIDAYEKQFEDLRDQIIPIIDEIKAMDLDISKWTTFKTSGIIILDKG